LYERVHWYIVVFDGNKAQYMKRECLRNSSINYVGID
jgi:hypothetical protein